MYLVYILRSENKSYIGMTNDFLKRWMQHNRYISGGAKYTTRHYTYWEPICILDGFKNKISIDEGINELVKFYKWFKPGSTGSNSLV